MPKSSNTQITIEKDFIRITPCETIDMDNSRLIESRFMAEYEGKNLDVLFDLSETTALFSSGVGLILRIYNRVKERGHSLSLVNVDPKTCEALDNMGITRVVEIFPTEADIRRP